MKDNGERCDLATVDILRDRERGVPRYNAFRRMVHKAPYETFEEMTDDPQWAQEIRHVYNNDIEKVDLMVGLMAEPLSTVLTRHFPELAPALKGKDSAFHPWNVTQP